MTSSRLSLIIGSFVALGTLQPRKVEAVSGFQALPMHFVENRGQWNTVNRFVVTKGPLAAAFESNGIAISLGWRMPLYLRFENSSNAVSLAGETKQPTQYNFYTGGRERWRTGVPAYGSVLYRGLYHGIDLRVLEQAGTLEYDLLLAPHAKLDRVVIRASGSTHLTIDAGGSLEIHSQEGFIRQRPPKTWQVLANGNKQPLECRFRKIGNDSYGFEAPARKPELAMVVDPGLEWSTYLGGNNGDWIHGAAAAGDGSIVVAGITASSDFPNAPGSPFSQRSFIARFDPVANTMRYITAIGGVPNGTFLGPLAADATGGAVLVGYVTDPAFPMVGGAQTTYGGNADGLVLRFNASGVMTASTFLGGAAMDTADAVALDGAGNVYAAGRTRSTNFRTTQGAFDTTFNPAVAGDSTAVSEDAYLVKLTSDLGTILYSTYFGGQTYELPRELAVDPNGVVTMVGVTSASAQGNRIPITANAIDSSWNGSEDVFVARFALNGHGAADLKYSSFLGGINIDGDPAVALHPTNPEIVTVAGYSWVDLFANPRFPTTAGSYKSSLTPFPPATSTFPHVKSGWVTQFRFPPTGSPTMLWSTFIGGNTNDAANDVAMDASGNVIVLGSTRSFDFPTLPGAYDRTLAGPWIGAIDETARHDCFVAKLNSTGSQLLYGTYLGGSGEECQPTGEQGFLAYLGGSRVAVAGITHSEDFRVTPGAYQTSYGNPGVNANDGFISVLSLDPISGDTTVNTPVLAAPSNGMRLPGSGDIEIRWNAVADPSGIEAYHYQFATRSDFDPNFIQFRGSVSTPYFLIRSPSLGTHFWRIQAADRAGNLSSWSPAFTVTIGDNSAPAALSFLSVSPSRVNGGSAATGTAYLTGAAPTGGSVVTLTSLNPGVATAPPTVTVPAGATSANFTVMTSTVSTATIAGLKATLGYTQTATLTVDPASTVLLSAVSVNPSTVTGGSPSAGTVTLSGPAPSGGAAVVLSSNMTSVATVPLTVVVPAGSTNANFPVTTFSVAAATQVYISAGYQSVSLFTTLTVNPGGGGGGGTLTTPSLISPANGVRLPRNQSFVFSWSAVSGAASYTIQVDDSSSFPAPLTATQTVTGTSVTLSGLPRQTLWWRVRANNSSGPGPWSTVRSFRID